MINSTIKVPTAPDDSIYNSDPQAYNTLNSLYSLLSTHIIQLYTYLLGAALDLLALLALGGHGRRALDGLIVSHLGVLVQIELVLLLIRVVLLALDHLCSQHVGHAVDMFQTHLDVLVLGIQLSAVLKALSNVGLGLS